MAVPQIHEGIYNAQTPKLQKCQLTTPDGGTYELKNMVVELSLHEDIYSFCVGGHIMIRDGQGLIELFKFNGGEFVEIQFDKTSELKNIKNYLNPSENK